MRTKNPQRKILRLHRKQKALLICVICVAVTSCKFFNRKISKNFRKNTFILENSVQFIRDAQSQTTSSLKFDTKADGHCEFRIFPQEMDPTIKTHEDKLIPCRNSAPTTKFAEAFSELRTDTLYTVEIYAWPANASRESAEASLFHEILPEGRADRLNFVTFNLPLYAAQARSLALKKESRLFDLYQYGKPHAGCRIGKNQIGIKRMEAYDDVPMTNAKLLGYLIAEKNLATTEDIILFNRPDVNQSLTIELSNDSEKDSASFGQLGKFTNVTVEGNEKKTLVQSFLNAPAEQITAAGDLKFSWDVSYDSPQSYIEVEVSSAPQKKEILCYFDAKIKEGSITSQDFLNTLPKGIYEVTVRYVFRQVKLFDTKFPWFISSHDWRNFRLERI